MLSGPWKSIASDDDEGRIADKECIMMQEEEWEVLKVRSDSSELKYGIKN